MILFIAGSYTTGRPLEDGDSRTLFVSNASICFVNFITIDLKKGVGFYQSCYWICRSTLLLLKTHFLAISINLGMCLK